MGKNQIEIQPEGSERIFEPRLFDIQLNDGDGIFTPRQQELLAHVLEGETCRQELAQALCVEEGTVRNHMSLLFKRMEAVYDEDPQTLTRAVYMLCEHEVIQLHPFMPTQEDHDLRSHLSS